MFCPKCGDEINANDEVCPKCGAMVGQNDPSARNNIENADSRDSASPLKAAPLPEKRRGKAKLLICVVAAIVVLIVGVAIGVNAYQERQAEIARQEAQAAYEAEQAALEAKTNAQNAIDDALVASDLSTQEEVMKGVASNDYVEETPYSVSSFSISSKDVDDQTDRVTITGDLVIENGFFSQKSIVTAVYGYESNEYTLESAEVGTSEVEPLRGISQDSEHGVSSAESSLSGTKCTVQISGAPEDYWFGKVQRDTVYTYEFDGLRWSYAGEETDESIVDVSGIYATYVDPRGGTTDEHGFFESFIISEPATGDVSDADMEFTWYPAGRTLSGTRMRIEGPVSYKGSLYLSVQDGNIAFQGDVGGYLDEASPYFVNVRGCKGLITSAGITFEESSEWQVEEDGDAYTLQMGKVVLNRA